MMHAFVDPARDFHLPHVGIRRGTIMIDEAVVN